MKEQLNFVQIKELLSQNLKKDKILTGINYVSAGFLIIVGVLQIILFGPILAAISLQFYAIFTPFFLIIFGIMLLTIEKKPEIAEQYFKFINTFLGRGLFYVFLSSVVVQQIFGGQENQMGGFMWGVALWLIGIYYLIQYCRGISYFHQNNNNELSTSQDLHSDQI